MSQPFPNLGSLAPLLSLVLILNAFSFEWQLAADHRFQVLSRIVVISQLIGAIVAAVGYFSRWPGALVLLQLALSGTLTLAVAAEIGLSSLTSLLSTIFHSNSFRLSSLLSVLVRNLPLTMIYAVQAIASNVDLVAANVFLTSRQLGELTVINRVGLALFGLLSVLNIVLYGHLLRGVVGYVGVLTVGALSGVLVSIPVLLIPEIILGIIAGAEYQSLTFELRLACFGLVAGGVFNAVVTLVQHASAKTSELDTQWMITIALGITLVMITAVMAVPYGVPGFIIFAAIKFSLLTIALWKWR